MVDLIIKLMIKVTLINFSNSEIGSNDLNFMLLLNKDCILILIFVD